MRARPRICFQLGALGVVLLGACLNGLGTNSPINAMTADTHVAKFPITSGFHAGVDCNSCHGAFDTFTQFTCIGCHLQAPTAAQHVGVTAYAYNSSSCYACHPRADHTLDFPIAATDVHNSTVAACTSCHTNLNASFDVTTINCIGCHNNNTTPPLPVDVGGVNSKHTTPAIVAAIAGYAFDSSTPAAMVATNGLCLKCHAGTIATPSWTDPLKFPLTQHNTLCFNVTSLNHNVSRMIGNTPACFKCHDTMNTTTKTWGVDWTVANCSACHGSQGGTPTCR